MYSGQNSNRTEFPMANRASYAGEVSSEEEESMELKGPISEMDEDVRRGFVRKVYGILSAQLLFTFIVAAPFPMFLGEDFMRSGTGQTLYMVCMVASLALIFGLVCCCQQAARTFPSNYIFLMVFTLVQSMLVGMITCMYTTNSVLLAVATTTVVFLSLTAFACCTDIDFTGMGVYLYGALMCMLGFGMVLMIWSCFAPLPGPLHMLFSLMGVLLFSMFIIYDTQMIIGGRHKTHQFDVDDYAFAALNLYLDIINLFLYLLSLMGNRN